MGLIVNPVVQGASDSPVLMNHHRGPYLQSRLSAELDLNGCVMIGEWFVGLIYTTKFFNVKRTPAAAENRSRLSGQLPKRTPSVDFEKQLPFGNLGVIIWSFYL